MSVSQSQTQEPYSPEEKAKEEDVRQIMSAVRVGAFMWDIRTGRLQCDDVVLATAGLSRKDFDGHIEAWAERIHPDDMRRVRAIAEEAVRKPIVHLAEYRLLHPDGSVVWVKTRGQTLVGKDGRPDRIVGTVWDVTHSRHQNAAADRALRYISDGFYTVDIQWRVTYLNPVAESLLGKASKVLGRKLWDVVPEYADMGLQDSLRQVMAGGEPLEVNLHSPRTQHWYHVRAMSIPSGMALLFTDIDEQRAREAELSRLKRLSMQRTTGVEALTLALTQAVTVRNVYQATAKYVKPLFGPRGIAVQAAEGRRLRTVGATGIAEDILQRLEAAPVASNSALREALRGKTAKFLTSTEELSTLYPGITEDTGSRHNSAWVFLPMNISGQPIGCILLSFPQQYRVNEEDRALLTALGGLISQAFERARLFDMEHARAQELQLGMLPSKLPSLPAVTAAASYLPAAGGTYIGGDWYDVIRLSSGRVALVVGDVMGHGVNEAVTMGRLRTAVHTLADVGMPPDELLGHLNNQVSRLGDDFSATCLYAVYDPTNAKCTYARAGHPPPAVVHPDGTVKYASGALAPPLGAAHPPFDTAEMELPEGSLLVLYTDGLVKSRTRHIDEGMGHLEQTLTTALPKPDDDGEGSGVSRICEAITSSLVPDRKKLSDDAVLLVARMHRLPPENIASWPLPTDAVAAGLARKYVREQLEAWHLEELLLTTELLVSELVSNVVRHAKGPVGLRLLYTDVLVCEVSDGSLSTPHIRRASETDEGGRGLQLVEALAQHWGTRYTRNGKSIWTEQPLPVR